MSTPSQLNLFGNQPPLDQLQDADITFDPAFLDRTDSDRLFASLHPTTAWQQDTITLYGKTSNLPRLTAWFGDPDAAYTYSRIRMRPHAWTDELLTIKKRVEVGTGECFNSVLLNLYRDGDDCVSWHSDDEPELGPEPVIASLSLGATRRFVLKHKTFDLKAELALNSGSLLVMRGPTQTFWRHQVPREARVREPRLNLTFRRIRP